MTKPDFSFSPYLTFTHVREQDERDIEQKSQRESQWESQLESPIENERDNERKSQWEVNRKVI